MIWLSHVNAPIVGRWRYESLVLLLRVIEISARASSCVIRYQTKNHSIRYSIDLQNLSSMQKREGLREHWVLQQGEKIRVEHKQAESSTETRRERAKRYHA